MDNDPGNDRLLDPQRYQQPDPRTRQEVGGILERAFQQEGGRIPDEVEATRFKALIEETEARLLSAEHQAAEAEIAAVQAVEQYARSQRAEDLEIAQRWQEESVMRRREVQLLQEEAERLRKFSPPEGDG